MSNNLNVCKAPMEIGLIAPGTRAGSNYGLKQVADTINTWIVRGRQRRDLAQLDARMLDDVGISEEQREIELSKPFWVE